MPRSESSVFSQDKGTNGGFPIESENRIAKEDEENEALMSYRIVYSTSEEITSPEVALSEGLSHLATLAIYYMFKDDLKLSPSQVSLLFVAPAFPWFLKPLFAFYSDSYPLFGYRRKPYLIFFSVLQSLGYILLSLTTTGVIGAVLSLFIIAFSSAFSSAVAEALIVELTKGNKQDASDKISDFTIAKGFGSLLVAYFSGYLLEKFSKKYVFFLTASFPCFITFFAIFMRDLPTPEPTMNVSKQILDLGSFLSKRIIWGPVLFILAFMCGPDYDDALFFYYTNILDFNPAFMGTLRFTYGVAAILGTFLYRLFLHRISYRSLLLSTIIVSLPIYISPIVLISGLNIRLGISDKIFVLSGGFLNEAVAELQLMPLLILTACVCPSGLEGTAYSTMLSIRNLGSAISKFNSAIAMSAYGITSSNFTNLQKFIWICGIFNMIPLLFIQLIPSNNEIVKASG